MSKRGKYPRTKAIRKKTSKTMRKAATKFWKDLKGKKRDVYIKARIAKLRKTIKKKKRGKK